MLRMVSAGLHGRVAFLREPSGSNSESPVALKDDDRVPLACREKVGRQIDGEYTPVARTRRAAEQTTAGGEGRRTNFKHNGVDRLRVPPRAQQFSPKDEACQKRGQRGNADDRTAQ